MLYFSGGLINNCRLGFGSYFWRLIAIGLVLITTLAKSQTRFSDNLHLSLNYHYGYMIPEYSNLTYLVDKPVQSASINISRKTTGETDWEQIFKRPEYGISFFYSTLGNDKVHGRELALFPYFNLSIINRGRFRLYNETGIGLSYVTRKFDLDNNYLNVAVGSNLNIHYNMKFGLQYQSQKKWRLHAGASFDHFSNGNLSEPNLGLNYLTAYSGVDYLIGSESSVANHELAPHIKGIYFEGIYSVGAKHARALDSKVYFTSSATFEVKWKASRVINLGLGADLFFDTSTEIEMEARNKTDFSKQDNFKTGIHASQAFIYNRFSIILQEGIYLFLTDKVAQRVMYNRGIVRLGVTDRHFIQIAMKSHFNILDYPELGFGLKWR
jgi:hypothetical protein